MTRSYGVGAEGFATESSPRKGRARTVATSLLAGALLTVGVMEVVAPHAVERAVWNTIDGVTSLITNRNPEEIRNERLTRELKRRGVRFGGEE